jgi:hypothetical protein
MPALTRDVLGEEARAILRNLKDFVSSGKSTRMADISGALARGVSLDLGDYLLFLRKERYITLDPASTALGLTGEGERIAEGQNGETFIDKLGSFFAHRLDEPVEIRQEEITDVKRVAVQRPPVTRTLPTSPKPATPGAPEEEAGLAAGGYVRYDAIGAGTIATVYRGKHASLGVEVAVKELKDLFNYFAFLQRGEVVKRLKKELSAQAALRSPCVLEVLDQNCDVARPYWVVEYAPGGSLRKKLDDAAGALSLDVAVRAFFQLCHGLRVAHAAGIVHQGLKPENVLFDARGNARLSDFGLARVLESESQKNLPQLTVSGPALGYLAPEVIAKKGEAGPESDLYSLGILLYEMLTGQIPGRRSPLPSESMGGVPAALDPIFDKLTQDRKEERYRTIDELLADLSKAFPDGRHGAPATIVLYADGPPAAEAKPAPVAKKR